MIVQLMTYNLASLYTVIIVSCPIGPAIHRSQNEITRKGKN